MFKNRIVKNASWLICVEIIKSLLGLVISMISVRYLGPSNYGLINYASSLVAFLTPIMYLGFSAILVQELVNSPEEEGTILGTVVTMSLLSSVCCMVGLFCFVSIVNRGETETIVVCTLYSVLLFFESIGLIQYWFQAKLLSKYSSLVLLLAYTVVSAYKIFLLITQKSVRWFAISSSVDYCITAVGLFIVYRKLGGDRLRFSWTKAKRMLNKGRYYILADMMVSIFAQTDRIMLKLMLDSSATGYYSAAVTCATMSGFVFDSIIDSFRPVIIENKKDDECHYEKNMCQLFSIIIYVSLAQSFVMTFFSKFIIHFLYGTNYLPAAPALSLVVWCTTFSYVGAIRNIWILIENLERYLVLINIIGAVANIILNFVLIPPMGIMGAALATLLTQFFTNIVLGHMIKPIRPLNGLMFKSLNPRYITEIIDRNR